MKRLLTVVLLISTVFLVAACNAVSGNGDVTSEDFDVSGFTSIDFSGVGDVLVTFGDSESVTVRTDSNLQELMRVEVNGDTLELGQQPNTSLVNPTEITFLVTVVDLESVSASGAGDMTVEAVEVDAFSASVSGAGDMILEGVEGDSLDISVTGSGDVTAQNLDLIDLSVDITGAGDLTADGRATNLDLAISGAGGFSGFDLETSDVTVNISGAGSAEVNVNESLTGSVSGAGGVNYQGNPSVDVNESGAGSVESEN